MSPRTINTDSSKQHVRVFKALEPYVNVWDHGYRESCWNLEPDGSLKLLWQKPKHYLSKWDWQRDNKRQLAMDRFSPKHIAKAWRDGDPWYYTSSRTGKALQYIDLDDHEAHQQDRDRLYAVIVEIMGKWLYLDPQDRAYLKINYAPGPDDKAIAEANLLMKELAIALRGYAKGLGINSTVDLAKGTIAPLRGHAVLARLPAIRTDEDIIAFKSAPEVTLGWMRGLIDTLKEKTDYAQATKVVALNNLGLAYTSDTNFEAIPPEHLATASHQAKRKISGHAGGSISQFVLNREEMELLPSIYKSLTDASFYCYAMRIQTRCSDGRRVTAKDFQLALLVASIMRAHPNEDGSAPTARAEAIWNGLVAAGIGSRAWNCHVWKLVRDTLADLDWLEVHDNSYWFDPAGKIKGKAMRWELREAYAVRIEAESKEEERGIFIANPPHLVPCRWRPRRVPMPGTDSHDTNCLALMVKLGTKRKLCELNV